MLDALRQIYMANVYGTTKTVKLNAARMVNQVLIAGRAGGFIRVVDQNDRRPSEKSGSGEIGVMPPTISRIARQKNL